jgi:hypothetical protein
LQRCKFVAALQVPANNKIDPGIAQVAHAVIQNYLRYRTNVKTALPSDKNVRFFPVLFPVSTSVTTKCAHIDHTVGQKFGWYAISGCRREFWHPHPHYTVLRPSPIVCMRACVCMMYCACSMSLRSAVVPYLLVGSLVEREYRFLLAEASCTATGANAAESRQWMSRTAEKL